MFTRLIESGGRRRRLPGGQSGLSLLLHLAAGVGVVHATRRLESAAPPRTHPMVPIFVPRRPEVRPAAPSTGPSMPPAPDLPLDVITPPTELPISIPPVDPGQPFDGVRVRRQWEPDPCPAGCGPTAPVDSVFLAEAVDLPASIRWQPNPVYPASLRAAGISGRVTLQFTVDTLGRIEPGSVGSVESTQPAFERAAVAAIEASRFSPARIRGRPVRQLVRQTISFRIEP